MDKLYNTIKQATVVLLFLILFLYAIIQARMLLYPFALAILMTYLLLPVANWLERRRFPRILVNFVVIIFAFSVIIGVVYLVTTQTRQLMEDMPNLADQAKENIKLIGGSMSGLLGMDKETFNHWLGKQLTGSFEAGGQYLGTLFTATTGTVAAFGILPVYVFLLLYYRDKLHHFFMSIVPEKNAAKYNAVLHEISSVTIHYMRGVCTVVLILCVMNSLGLWLIGLPFALLLGIISALCNFIPYFGTLLGALFPLSFALFATDTPSLAVRVVIMFLVVQFTENNILTPNITGGSVQINPMVTILGIVAGGLVWGLPGMFVVVPFMGMMKIVLESNPETRPLAYLISNNGTEKHAITLKKLTSFFGIRPRGKSR